VKCAQISLAILAKYLTQTRISGQSLVLKAPHLGYASA